jgi:hypothetical protein
LVRRKELRDVILCFLHQYVDLHHFCAKMTFSKNDVIQQIFPALLPFAINHLTD